MDQHGSIHDEHEERLRELLLLQRVARRISSIDDVHGFVSDSPAVDDLTVVMIRATK